MRIHNYYKVIFPSTLGIICECFINGTDIYEIEFNERLSTIEHGAFENCRNLGKYKNMKMPQCLRKIGGGAFYNCYNMEPLILNEGLVEIGDEAFYCDGFEEMGSPAQLVILPSTVRDVGTNIVNPKFVKNLGFKNYKGQEIPGAIFDTFYPTLRVSGNITEKTLLKNILLFEGDNLNEYMRINPKKLMRLYKSQDYVHVRNSTLGLNSCRSDKLKKLVEEGKKIGSNQINDGEGR